MQKLAYEDECKSLHSWFIQSFLKNRSCETKTKFCQHQLTAGKSTGVEHKQRAVDDREENKVFLYLYFVQMQS